MVRYTGPKNRIARKFGVNLFNKSRNPLLHRPQPPGQHGAKRKKKSDYGMQLEEKQMLLKSVFTLSNLLKQNKQNINHGHRKTMSSN